MPLGNWMLSRVNGDDWIIFDLIDNAYGLKPMTVHQWTDSFSHRMVLGLGPKVAPRCADVPAYVNSPAYERARLGAYVAATLEFPDGRLWGLISGVDPEPMSEDLHQILPEMEFCAKNLMNLYLAELHLGKLDTELLRRETPQWLDQESHALNQLAWNHDCVEDDWVRTNYLDPNGVIAVRTAPETEVERLVECLSHLDDEPTTVYRLDEQTFALTLRGLIKVRQQSFHKEVKKILDRRFPGVTSAYAYRGPTSTLAQALAEAKKHLGCSKDDRSAA
ncbi:MAG: hypothetical protein JST51_02620 [Armatimonadetes bacterium]|nr:hypothetical protein [Armatimonadota bacterium]